MRTCGPAGGPALGLLWALALPGCHPAPQTTPAVDNDPEQGAKLNDNCGAGGETFTDHRWIPGDARFVASVQLDAPDLDAALGHLEAVARADNNGLPVTVGFTLSQLRLEVSILREQLRAAGFRPAQLVRLGAPDGALAWVFRSTCDLGEAKLRAGATWKLDLRITSDGTLGQPRPDSGFPYVVLFLAGDRVALVPTANADAARAWLGRRASPGTDNSDPAGPRLDKVATSPIRIVLGGRAFVSGDDAKQPPRSLRATGEGLEIDGSLPSSP